MLAGALTANAAPQPQPVVPTAQSAQQIDLNLRQLKEEAVNVKAELQLTEQTLLYPDTSRVIVYFGVPIPGLLVQSISVTIDDGKPFVYRYDNLEAIALQTRGLQPLLKLNAGYGRHRIVADVAAQFADQPNAAPVISHVDSTFTKDRAPLSVELSMSRDSVVSRPALRMREWVAEK